MFGLVFAIIVSVGLPFLVLLYTFVKKRYLPFLLGVIAFVGSQLLIRIPILEFLQGHSTAYSMFRALHPILFAIVLGLSAGIVEGIGRFIMMRFFMKQRNWGAGFLFGAGHGGIEAIVFVGVNAIVFLFSPLAGLYSSDFLIGGLERFFAMMLHIGLSIMVLQGIVQKKFRYVLLAILIHGFVDSLVGILPQIIPASYVLFVIEASVAIIALAVFTYGLLIKRKGVLQ